MEKKNNIMFVRMIQETPTIQETPIKNGPKEDVVDKILLENPLFFL